MDAKRIPLEKEEPKHRKKSNKKGQPRADHKHEYKTVLLHSYFDNPFKPGERNESKHPTKVCMICGRVGNTDLSRYDLEEIPDMPYRIHRRVIKDEELLEKWYVDDHFGKFAYRRQCLE